MTDQELQEFLNSTNLTGVSEMLQKAIKLAQEQLRTTNQTHNELLSTLQKNETKILQIQGELTGYVKLLEQYIDLKPKSDIEFT